MGVSALPVVGFLPGMVMAYAGPTAQPGWLLCDGSLLNRADYPQLFAAIGVAYNIGGESGTQFRIPNLKGKVIAMQDTGQIEFDVLGESGGAKTVALAQGEMPSHNHSITVDSNNFSSGNQSVDHSHYVNGNNFNTGGVSANHYHGIGHYHTGWIGNHLWAGNGVHNGHYNHGGFTAEAPEPYSNWASGPALNIDGTARGAPNGDNASGWISVDHSHNANHDHGSAGVSANHSHTVNHSHTGSSTTTGSGTAHNNLQPYLTMNYLIKV